MTNSNNQVICAVAFLCCIIAMWSNAEFALAGQNTRDDEPQTQKESSSELPKPEAQKTDSTKSDTKETEKTESSLTGKEKEAESVTADKAKKKKLRFKKQGGLVYHKGEDFRLTCDSYVPEGEGPYPAVLMIHGGGWRSGTKLHMLRHAWRLAKQGYVCVAINYRHAPKHKFPAQIHDCKQAVRWMRQNSTKLKIDPDRIGAFGYSAGGHLASLLATTSAKDGLEGPVPKGFEKYSTQIHVAAVGGAPCEFDWIRDGSPALVYWLGKKKQDQPEIYLKASPTHYVDAKDPPIFLYHGLSDMIVPPSTSQAMHAKLKSAGVTTKLLEVKDKGHFQTFSHFDSFDIAISFLNDVLKK